MEEILDLMLNSDELIGDIINTYGTLTYLILFSIIFIETGFVVTNFFPGDGLLFSAGILAASGELNFSILLILLSFATILGNTSNYMIGKYVGKRFFKKEKARRNHYLEKSIIYYEKNETKAIVTSRFIPFLRSFVPFTAGILLMNFRTFTLYNIIGGIIWIAFYLLLGFYFGEIPFVKANYGLLFFGMIIILISGLLIGMLRPIIFKIFRGK